MKLKTKATSSTAIFSPCQKYRYVLNRKLSAAPGHLAVIMLNPSTACQNFNDPTVARVENFAEREGFGEYTVLNLFAIRATDPKLMLVSEEPVGPENDYYIAHTVLAAGRSVVCAWGNHGVHCGRAARVVEILRGVGAQMWCWKLTTNGNPAHPLYLPGKMELQNFGG